MNKVQKDNVGIPGDVIAGHAHVHAHYHSPEEKKKQLNRLAKASGHLTHVKTMIENDEDCSEVLMQLAAVDAIEDGDTEAIEEFKKAISKYM